MAKTKPGFLYKIPFYPLLLGVYPVLYLWLVNVFQVPATLVFRPLWISLALTVIVCGLSWLILRHLRSAAAVAGLFLAMFFFYGRIFDQIDKWQIFNFIIGRHRYLAMLLLVIFIGVVVLIIRSRSNLYTLTWISNLVVSFLLLMTIGQLAYYLLGSSYAAPSTLASDDAKSAALSPQSNPDSPDVYYILMDGYDRQDLLKQDIGLSNQAFITQLEQLGFVFPTCTQSNYNTTVFSVAGTFNMNYLDALGFSYSELSKAEYGIEFSTPQLEASIHANPVMRQFKSMGYQIITFQEGYPFINFPNSDIVYSNANDTQSQAELSKFQFMFWKTTGFEYLIDELTHNSFDGIKDLPDWIQQALSDNFALYQKYQQDLYQLNALDHITEVPGKKFLYAHLMVTHPDFAFTASGQFRDNSEVSKDAYGDQITYVNQRILAIVKNILATSKTPPIIILQGDHGYELTTRGIEQFKILNAYYLPQGGNAAIYSTITPVNTFRLILSRYFGQNYPLLPDQSIWIQSQFSDGHQLEPGTCQPQP